MTENFNANIADRMKGCGSIYREAHHSSYQLGSHPTV